jgi:hypothetical protein
MVDRRERVGLNGREGKGKRDRGGEERRGVNKS